MKLNTMLVIVFLTLDMCSNNMSCPVIRSGTPDDYDLSFFAAGQDLSPCSNFFQSDAIYFIFRICNTTDDILIQNCTFPTPLEIQVLDSVGFEIFNIGLVAITPDSTIQVYPNKIISYTFLWDRFQGQSITTDSPIPQGFYTAILQDWAYGDSAVTFALAVQ